MLSLEQNRLTGEQLELVLIDQPPPPLPPLIPIEPSQIIASLPSELWPKDKLHCSAVWALLKSQSLRVRVTLRILGLRVLQQCRGAKHANAH